MADIQFTQGEDVAIGLTITDSDNVAIDITSDIFTAKIKDISNIDVDVAVFTASITDGPAGKVSFNLTDTDTLQIPQTVEFNAKGLEVTTPLRILMYDMFREDHITGLKRKLVSGMVKVYPVMSFDGV